MTLVLCDVTPLWWPRHWPTRRTMPSRGLIARAVATLTALGDHLEAFEVGPAGVEVRLRAGQDASIMQEHGVDIREALQSIGEEPAEAPVVWN